MAHQTWKTALVVLASVIAGFCLAGSGVLSKASAQMEGSTLGHICVVGGNYNGYAPIVLVDVPDQTIVVYEYNYGGRNIKLVSARSFKYDKLLQDYETRGPTVDAVRGLVAP